MWAARTPSYLGEGQPAGQGAARQAGFWPRPVYLGAGQPAVGASVGGGDAFGFFPDAPAYLAAPAPALVVVPQPPSPPPSRVKG